MHLASGFNCPSTLWYTCLYVSASLRHFLWVILYVLQLFLRFHLVENCFQLGENGGHLDEKAFTRWKPFSLVLLGRIMMKCNVYRLCQHNGWKSGQRKVTWNCTQVYKVSIYTKARLLTSREFPPGSMRVRRGGIFFTQVRTFSPRWIG